MSVWFPVSHEEKAMTSQQTIAAIFSMLFCYIAIGATSPETVKQHIKAAQTFEDSNDFTAAIKEYDSALAIASDKEEIFVLRGGVKFKNNDFSGAINDYSSAISLNERDAILYVMRGLSYSLLKPSNNFLACRDFSTAAKLGYTAEAIPGQTEWCAEVK
jgi:tetratricopeptide (TPR) repeat protein